MYTIVVLVHLFARMLQYIILTLNLKGFCHAIITACLPANLSAYIISATWTTEDLAQVFRHKITPHSCMTATAYVFS